MMALGLSLPAEPESVTWRGPELTMNATGSTPNRGGLT
jgi:hypothetical protein